MGNIQMEIAIPTDNDGFVLLKCPLCGEYFKLTPKDIEADDVIEIWCPCCGLKSENYLTEDVIGLAKKMIENVTMDLLFKQIHKWEHQFQDSRVSLKAGKKPTPKVEESVVAGIEALETENFDCCKRQAKIKPLVKLSGSYCPFCGVSYDGNK